MTTYPFLCLNLSFTRSNQCYFGSAMHRFARTSALYMGLEGFVAGDDETGAFVAGGHQLENRLAASDSNGM